MEIIFLSFSSGAKDGFKSSHNNVPPQANAVRRASCTSACTNNTDSSRQPAIGHSPGCCPEVEGETADHPAKTPSGPHLAEQDTASPAQVHNSRYQSASWNQNAGTQWDTMNKSRQKKCLPYNSAVKRSTLCMARPSISRPPSMFWPW